MSELLERYRNKEVVLDTDASFSYVGRLMEWDDRHLEIESLTVYDARIIKVSLEEFLVECRRNGLCDSRGNTLIARNRILAISLFDDVVVP